MAFLVGLLRSRLARGGLADLFRDLKSTGGVGLQQALSKTLGDPSLVVAYRLPESLGYADADGRPVLVPPVAADRSAATVESDGTELAALVYDAALDDDPELVEAVRAAAGMALENERLQAEAHARLAEVQASRERIVAASDAERRRWSATCTTAPSSGWSRCRCSCGSWRAAWATTRRRGRWSRPRARSSPNRSRSCASSRAGSTPPCSTTASPPRWTRWPRARPCRRRSPTRPTSRLLEPVELAAYFVASEALTNVAKYAQATAATVRVSRERRNAVIEIADDGVGGADAAARLGTARARRPRRGARRPPAAWSSPPGAGTTVDRGAAVRVVIADDSILVREGIASILPGARASRWSAQAGDRGRAARRGRRARARRGDRRRAHAADAHRRGAARGARRSARGTREIGDRDPLPARRGRDRDARCWPRPRRASATCSRTASPTSTTSSARCGASPPAARRSTPRSSRGCSPRARDDGPLHDASPRASARCSS